MDLILSHYLIKSRTKYNLLPGNPAIRNQPDRACGRVRIFRPFPTAFSGAPLGLPT
jgi:hypothetical protein